MGYPQDLKDLSKEEKIKYYKALSQMTSAERREDRNIRFKEMLQEGMKPSEAVTVLDGEEMEARELLRDEKIKEKRMEKEGKSTWDIKEEWTPEERASGMRQRPLTEQEKKDFIPTQSIEEEEGITEPEPSDFLRMKQKAESEKDEYISDLERKERNKEVVSGLLGFGSREPLKEEIIKVGGKVLSGVVSGAKKLGKEIITGKPKTKAEIRRSEELEEAKHRARVRTVGRGERILEPRGEREPSLRDLGRGSLGAERYEKPFTPDFFGGGIGSGKSPMGEPERRVRRESRPPSTTIPFGGSRAPSTGIPMGGSRPPSTTFSSGGRRAPETRVPIIKEKPPKVTYRGSKKISTRIPKGSKKAPVKLEKTGKPISTRIGKPLKIKTRVPRVQEDAVDILGLKGFW